jgi:hypothetical protein
MHTLTVATHFAWVFAVGRGIFIWLLLRNLVHAVGWPIAIGMFVTVAVLTMYVRNRRRS